MHRTLGFNRILCLMLLLISVSFMQANSYLDSLQLKVEKCKTSECEIDVQLSIAEYFMHTEPQKALEVCNAIHANNDIFKFPDKQALLYRYTGVVYRNMSETDSTIKYIEKSLELFQQQNNQSQIILLYNDLGSLYSAVGAYTVSLNYFLKALKLCEEIDSLKSIDLLYNSIGNAYGYMKQYDMSNGYYDKALGINKNTGLKGNLLLNKGINYSELGVYDSAIYYISLSNQIHRSFNALENLYSNYISYANAFALSARFDSAHFYIDQSVAYYQSTDNEWMLGYCYDIKGNAYRMQKKFTLAKPLIADALSILGRYQDLWALKETYLNAYKLENDIGNSKGALDYYLKYTHLNDSISNAELKSEVYHLDKIYETEKKEARILLLNKENEIKAAKIKRNTIILISFMVLSFLLITLAFVLKRSNNFKTQTNLILAEKNEQLRTLNATKDKLFSIIAHDLKNPLSAFRNITGSLKNQFTSLSKEDIEEFVTDLYDSSSKLMDLLQNLLKWAVSQTNNIKVEKQVQPVLPLVSSAIASVQYNAEEKNIKITNTVDENLTADIDVNILETILRNFISNAVKFTPENGEINVFYLMQGDKIKLCVADNGIGIKPEDQQKLFSINENVSKIGSSPEKGTGLGLILCKELIEKMGGTIGAESVENKGSTFYITF
jgi:signal transduction histidine kinase